MPAVRHGRCPMRQLMRLFDGLMAGELQRVLEAAGIEAQVTMERENAYLAEGADAGKVEAACRAAWGKRKEMAEAAKKPVTRVSVSEDLVKCLGCGYDLRGQEQDGKCPECGYPYEIIRVKVCPDCGAEMPGDFEVCWNCSGEEDVESPE